MLPPAPPAADRIRPWLFAAMLALLVARPLFPSESAAGQGDGLPVVMLWLALAVVWLLGAVSRPSWPLRFGRVDAAVLLLVGLAALSGLVAVRRGSPRPTINMLWEWVGLGLVFCLARQLVRTAREVRATVAVMLALSAGISGYGLYQYAVELPALRAAYAVDPDRVLRQAGLWYPPGSPGREVFQSRLESPEPLATFALTNSLAALLAPWLVVGVAIAARRVGLAARLAALACCLLPAGCLLLTKSRSGYVAVGVGLLVLWSARRGSRWSSADWGEDRTTGPPLPPGEGRGEGNLPWSRKLQTQDSHQFPLSLTLSRRERGPRTRDLPESSSGGRLGWKAWAGAAAAAATVIVALAVAGPLRPPLARAATSFGYRVQYWRATMHLIADFPWVGCGPGNFQNTYTRYKLPEAVEEVADPHNFLLEVWATAGTPAMLALLAVLGCFAVTVYGPRQGSRHTPCACYVPAGEDRPVPWRFSLLGMTAGFVLALPLGRLSPAAPAAIAVLLGLPVAAGCLALLSGWVRQGQFPPRLAGLGVGVLLVDLLATGGIALPGIAESFWLLVALGLAGDPVRRASRGAAMAALWLLLAASVGCYATAYAPVLGCQGWLGRARQDLLGGRWAEAQRDLELAAAADPLSAEPHWQLAAAFLEDWLTRPDDQCYRRFEEQDAAAVRLAPQSAAGWLASGDRYQRAYRKNDRQGHPLQPGAIQEAVARYGRAVELYPTSPLCRARLALARQMAGRGS